MIDDWIANDLIIAFEVLSSLCCVYLVQAILRERSALVHLQRVTLGLVSFAFLFDALTSEQWWDLFGVHRYGSALIIATVSILLFVMCLRGRMLMQDYAHHTDRFGGPIIRQEMPISIVLRWMRRALNHRVDS